MSLLLHDVVFFSWALMVLFAARRGGGKRARFFRVIISVFLSRAINGVIWEGLTVLFFLVLCVFLFFSAGKVRGSFCRVSSSRGAGVGFLCVSDSRRSGCQHTLLCSSFFGGGGG